MMRILLLVLLLTLCGARQAAAVDACSYSGKDASSATPATLKRGINLSRWWEDDRHQALKPDEVKKLAALGFDFVRLPLSPTWLMLSDEKEQKETLVQLHCNLIALLDADLAVIVDLHAPERFQRNLKEDSDDAAELRLEKLWQHMQPVLEGLPAGRIFISFYNEPKINAESWWRIQGQLIKNLRVNYPNNPFVVTAGPDGGPWSLENMQAYDDKNVIYDFHFYQPMEFTHHGADWLDSYRPGDKSARIVYPVAPGAKMDDSNANVKDYVAGDWNHLRLRTYIDKAADWATQNGAKIACLEFGVYRPYVDTDSRAHWLKDMRNLLEQSHIPWAMWEYRGSFGLLDDNGSPDPSVVRALDLKHGFFQ